MPYGFYLLKSVETCFVACINCFANTGINYQNIMNKAIYKKEGLFGLIVSES